MAAAEAFHITLRSSDGHDALQQRRLSLYPDKPYTIGRASTNTLKPELMETADNAFICSPVISRDHAAFTLTLSPPAVNITDHNSMHGTMVNGVKLKPHRATKLNNGDVLQFGADVTRNERYFVARKYTFDAPTIGTLEPDTSAARVFTVPDTDSEEEEDEEEEDIAEDGQDRKDTKQKPSLPPRSYIGSQANPVTIEDAANVTPEIIEVADDEEGVPTIFSPPEQNEAGPSNTARPTTPQGTELNHEDFDFDALPDEDPLDAPHSGPSYSSDGGDADEYSSSYHSDSDLDDASDGDARTDFEVSDEEEEENNYFDEDEGVDEDEESQAGEPVDTPSRTNIGGLLNHEEPTIRPANAIFNSPVVAALSERMPPQQPALKAFPHESRAFGHETPSPNSYKVGPFAGPQGSYPFGCVDATLPYGGESSRLRSSGFSDYVSPYVPREPDLFAPPAFEPPPKNPYIHAMNESYGFPPFFNQTPVTQYNPLSLAKSTVLEEPAITSAPPAPPRDMQTPPPTESSPQPIRRTKVSIPEIVEEAPPQQPPTPTSESGSLKRKADEMEKEDEVIETAAAEPSSPATAESESNNVMDTPPVTPDLTIQNRPKKRLRRALGSAAKMAAYLVPGTAIAVGVLTQLPDSFFQG